MKTSFAILLLAAALPLQAAETKVSTDGGLDAETDAFSFELGGRIMVDMAIFDEDITPLEDGMEFRRARLELEGTLYSDWGYKAQVDFAGNEAEIKDMYLAYAGLGEGELMIGQFKQFMGLEELTSSKYTTFMELGTTSVFYPSRKIGVGYLWKGANSTFGVSAYGNEAGEGLQNDGLVNFSTRYTYAPWSDEGNVLHLGISAVSESADDTNTVGFSQRPEAHLAPRLIGATIADADGSTRLGLEAAWVAGPFSLQGEYIDASVQRTAGFEDLSFDGYYVQASYFLTGESRPYKAGTFGRVKPENPAGAWEIAARLSNLNLVDGAVDGGELNDLTLGLNWYANPHTRFMANYVKVEAEQGGVVDEPGILEFRAQIDF